MNDGAIAVGRPLELHGLLPPIRETCVACAIDVGTGDFLPWVSMPDIKAALAFQESAADRRVGDGGGVIC